MFEIKENQRVLPDGTEITTYSRDIVSANILEVEAGTTGYKGGDSGHGGRTYFRIADAASTDIQVHPLGRYADEGFEVVLGGDCVLETMIRALKFITKVLEKKLRRCLIDVYPLQRGHYRQSRQLLLSPPARHHGRSQLEGCHLPRLCMRRIQKQLPKWRQLHRQRLPAGGL
jgi:hypothetical protein